MEVSRRMSPFFRFSGSPRLIGFAHCASEGEGCWWNFNEELRFLDHFSLVLEKSDAGFGVKLDKVM